MNFNVEEKKRDQLRTDYISQGLKKVYSTEFGYNKLNDRVKRCIQQLVNDGVLSSGTNNRGYDTYTQASWKPFIIESVIFLQKIKDSSKKLDELLTINNKRLNNQ